MKMNTKIQLPKINLYTDYDLYEEEEFHGLVPVLNKSKKKNKVSVRKIAEFFRREFNYDFVQFSEYDDDNYYAYLILPRCYVEEVIGAMCFRWREWEDAPPSWALQWVWLHPYFRNQGLLTSHWPDLKRKFGDFFVEGPLSSSMKGFLKKQEKLEMVKKGENHD